MAQPDAFLYRAGKFFNRYRLQAIAGSIAVGALLAGATIALIQAQRADTERLAAVAANAQAVASRTDALSEAERARLESEQARAVRDYLLDLFRGTIDPALSEFQAVLNADSPAWVNVPTVFRRIACGDQATSRP